MELIGGLALVYFFKFLYGLWKDNQEEKAHLQEDDEKAHLYDRALAQMDEERKEKERKVFMENNKGTKDLFIETLTKIGCQYQLAEEEGDNRIFFSYQGEHFFVIATNEILYIQIYDTHWRHVDLYDIDEFSRLRKTINESNLNNNVTTVYTIEEEGGNVYVHCKSTILFIPQIPNIEDYIKWVFNEFFRVHQYVNIEMAKQREKEK